MPTYKEETQATLWEDDVPKSTPILLERAKQWGDPVETHDRIAKVWEGIKGVPFTGHEVALMMAGMKLVRTANNPSEPDNYDDGPGYIEIAKMYVLPEETSYAAIRDQQ